MVGMSIYLNPTLQREWKRCPERAPAGIDYGESSVNMEAWRTGFVDLTPTNQPNKQKNGKHVKH